MVPPFWGVPGLFVGRPPLLLEPPLVPPPLLPPLLPPQAATASATIASRARKSIGARRRVVVSCTFPPMEPEPVTPTLLPTGTFDTGRSPLAFWCGCGRSVPCGRGWCPTPARSRKVGSGVAVVNNRQH